MDNAQNSTGYFPIGITSLHIRLLDTFLNKSLHSIPAEWRGILSPKFTSWTTAEFHNCFEKASGCTLDPDTFIPPDVFEKFENIYNSLKVYAYIFTCGDRSDENFKTCCEFLSQLGYNKNKVLKFYDPSHNRYKLFEALGYFIFEELQLNETDTFILKHHLNYSNEYALSNGGELTGSPDVSRKYFDNEVDKVKLEISRYMFYFSVLLPWFDYGDLFKLEKELVKISPLHLVEIKGKEKSEYLTIQLLVEIICTMKDYKIFLIEHDKTDNYILIKNEASLKSGIPANRKEIKIDSTDNANESGSVTILKRIIHVLLNLIF